MKLIILIAVLFVGAKAQLKATEAAEAKVTVVENIAKYLKANPNVTVTELQITRNARYNQIWYTIGARQSGDGLVGINNGWAQYPSKQNLELTITYPVNGQGTVVTYLQILVSQDNGTTGRGYVVSGGVGLRYIQVIVEAWNTSYIKYDYALYGR